MKLAYLAVSLSPLRKEPRDASEMVSQLFFGEPVLCMEQLDSWILIETLTDHYKGYVDIKQLRSLTEDEFKNWTTCTAPLAELMCLIQTPWGNQWIYRGAFIPRALQQNFTIGKDTFTLLTPPKKQDWPSPLEIALAYLNTPYLWGGKSPFGIDCSGLTQIVWRFFDVLIPRDAAQQVNFGEPIDFKKRSTGDLAFFHNHSGKIVHVGICGLNHQFIHASGHVRADNLTEEGIIQTETGELTHSLHSIRRMIT